MKTDIGRIKRLTKEASWIVIGQVVTVLGSLVLVRVLTEYLEPAQYGQLALGLTIASLVNQTVMGGMTAGIGRFYSIAAEKCDLHGYLRASRRLMGYATVAVLVLAMVLMSGLFWFYGAVWIWLAVATLAFSILSGYNASLGAIQNAARQRALVALHGGLEAWLRILAAVVVMLWLGSSSTTVMLGYALASLLVTGAQFFFLRRTICYQGSQAQNHKHWTHQIWTFAWPISVFGVFTWAQQISDRWALKAFASEEDTGLYALVFQLGYTPIGLITGMAMSFLGPILYQRAGAAANHARNIAVHDVVWRLTLAGLALTVAAFLFALVLHEWIFHVLVAAKYSSVSYLLPWVILAGGVFAVGQILALKLMSEMRPASMTSAKIVTAILGVGMNILGAAYFGIQGVVAALVLFSCIYFIWVALLTRDFPAVDS